MSFRTDEDARRVGKRSRHVTKDPPQLLEAFDLVNVGRVIGRRGVIEVAHQQRNATARGTRPGCQDSRLLHGNAKPAFAGAHVQGEAARPPAGGNEHVPFSDLSNSAQDGLRVGFRKRRCGAGILPAKNIDDRVWRSRSNTSGFRNVRNEKSLAAIPRQRSGDNFDAATVGVRPDHSGTFGRRTFCQRAPILHNRG